MQLNAHLQAARRSSSSLRTAAAASAEEHPDAVIVVRTLYVRIGDAKLSPPNVWGKHVSQLFCSFSGTGTGASVRSRIVAASTSEVFFGDEFELAVTQDHSDVLITIRDAASLRSLGQVTLNLSGLQTRKPVEAWFDVMPFFAIISGEIHVVLLRYRHRIFITIDRAVGLTASDTNGLSDPYIVVACGKAEYSTKVKLATLDPVYEEKFAFCLDDVQRAGGLVHLFVWDRDRLHHDDFIGMATVDTTKLTDGVEVDSWLRLAEPPADSPFAHLASHRMDDSRFDRNHAVPAIGQIRLKARYWEQTVLPLNDYQLLWQLLLRENFALLQAAGSKSDTLERLAVSTVSVFGARGQIVWFLRNINHAEIRATPDPGIIFRANSLASKATDMYCQLAGADYIYSTLIGALNETTRLGPLPLDPTIEPSVAVRTRNMERFIQLLRRFCADIFASAARCPPTVRLIYRNIWLDAHATFPDVPHIGRRSVVAFVLLRFFTAAISSPYVWQLVPTMPSQGTGELLVLLAKCILMTGSHTFFDESNRLSSDLNEVLSSLMGPMDSFLETLIAVKDEDATGSDIPPVDLKRQLNELYDHLCVLQDSGVSALVSPDIAAELKQTLADIALRKQGKMPHLTTADVERALAASSGADDTASPAASPPGTGGVPATSQGAESTPVRRRTVRRQIIAVYPRSPDAARSLASSARHEAVGTSIDERIRALERDIEADAGLLRSLRPDASPHRRGTNKTYNSPADASLPPSEASPRRRRQSNIRNSTTDASSPKRSCRNVAMP